MITYIIAKQQQGSIKKQHDGIMAKLLKEDFKQDTSINLSALTSFGEIVNQITNNDILLDLINAKYDLLQKNIVDLLDSLQTRIEDLISFNNFTLQETSIVLTHAKLSLNDKLSQDILERISNNISIIINELTRIFKNKPILQLSQPHKLLKNSEKLEGETQLSTIYNIYQHLQTILKHPNHEMIIDIIKLISNIASKHNNQYVSIVCRMFVYMMNNIKNAQNVGEMDDIDILMTVFKMDDKSVKEDKKLQELIIYINKILNVVRILTDKTGALYFTEHVDLGTITLSSYAIQYKYNELIDISIDKIYIKEMVDMFTRLNINDQIDLDVYSLLHVYHIYDNINQKIITPKITKLIIEISDMDIEDDLQAQQHKLNEIDKLLNIDNPFITDEEKKIINKELDNLINQKHHQQNIAAFTDKIKTLKDNLNALKSEKKQYYCQILQNIIDEKYGTLDYISSSIEKLANCLPENLKPIMSYIGLLIKDKATLTKIKDLLDDNDGAKDFAKDIFALNLGTIMIDNDNIIIKYNDKVICTFSKKILNEFIISLPSIFSVKDIKTIEDIKISTLLVCYTAYKNGSISAGITEGIKTGLGNIGSGISNGTSKIFNGLKNFFGLRKNADATETTQPLEPPEKPPEKSESLSNIIKKLVKNKYPNNEDILTDIDKIQFLQEKQVKTEETQVKTEENITLQIIEEIAQSKPLYQFTKSDYDTKHELFTNHNDLYLKTSHALDNIMTNNNAYNFQITPKNFDLIKKNLDQTKGYIEKVREIAIKPFTKNEQYKYNLIVTNSKINLELIEEIQQKTETKKLLEHQDNIYRLTQSIINCIDPDEYCDAESISMIAELNSYQQKISMLLTHNVCLVDTPKKYQPLFTDIRNSILKPTIQIKTDLFNDENSFKYSDQSDQFIDIRSKYQGILFTLSSSSIITISGLQFINNKSSISKHNICDNMGSAACA